MPTLRAMIDGKTVSAAGIAPIAPPAAGNTTNTGGVRNPPVKKGASPPPGNPAKPMNQPQGKASKGALNPLAQHISNHMQDPLGATKEGFQDLTQKKLQYDQAREEMQRNLAPVKSVMDHVSSIHGIQPGTPAGQIPTPGMTPAQPQIDPMTGLPMQGQDPMNPGENDDPDMDPITGNPANMSQTTGKMNQSRPSMTGHQPGVAPGDGQTVRPPKMGMPQPGAMGTPGSGPQPGAQKGQFGPKAAKPKGAGSMPGAKGPGDPKVAGKTNKAQQNSSRQIKVNVSASTPPLMRINASTSIEKYRGSEMLRLAAAGHSEGAKKGWSTRGHGHLSKTEKKAHYRGMKGFGMTPSIAKGGGAAMKRAPMMRSGAAQGYTKVDDPSKEVAYNPVMRAHGKGCMCAACKKKMEAGGPGSGRHPEFGKFEKVKSKIASSPNVVGYKSPNGHAVYISRNSAARSNKQPGARGYYPGNRGLVRVDYFQKNKISPRKEYVGDNQGASNHLKAKYGISL